MIYYVCETVLVYTHPRYSVQEASGRTFTRWLFFLHELWYNNLNKSSRPLEEAQEGGYLKGYGLCRERHCLWAVPLLILDFAVSAA